MSSTCLYINFDLDGNYGGGKYNRTILDILKELFSVVDTMSFTADGGRLGLLRNTLKGYLNGMDADFARAVATRLDKRRYDLVFLASSNFGKLAKAIKGRHPETRICTLFNNIELNFIKSQLSVSTKPQLLLTLAATYCSERNIARHSDRTIVLSEREARELKRLYGRQADAIIPITLKDEFDESCKPTSPPAAKNGMQTGLFVGSSFYANVHAVEWFAKNVAPQLKDTKIIVVGKGFERERRLQTDVMRIVGTVDSVAEYYKEADFVIAPIFKGAGMKVKTAEAMMYGKTIIGTPEAFEGYSEVGKYGVICRSAEDFASAINGRAFHAGFNAAARGCFLRHYSYESVKGQIAELLNF